MLNGPITIIETEAIDNSKLGKTPGTMTDYLQGIENNLKMNIYCLYKQ